MNDLLLTFKELRQIFPKNTITLDDQISPTGFCHDSRQIKPGEIFVALRTSNADGHDHIKAAFHAGGIAAIAEYDPAGFDNLLLCENSLLGFHRLASYYRDKFSQPVIAVTGSSGKTTTKELLAHILSAAGPTIATEGNLNNHIGVPLTIMRFKKKASFFIVEMGMNHLEEIRTLTRLAKPTIGLITCIGHAHLEGVGGTIQGVAKAKKELFDELDESNWAIVNLDDPWISTMQTRARKITYGMAEEANVRAKRVIHSPEGTQFILQYGSHEYPLQLKVTGKHHVSNSLAAFAIGQIVGIDTSLLLRQLENFELDTGRGRILKWQEHIFIDDTYNANPDSMAASLEALAQRYPDRRLIAVFGGMNELGEDAAKLHFQVGQKARELGIQDFLVLGTYAPDYLAGFGKSDTGIASGFSNHSVLAEGLKNHLEIESKPAAILVKGSRGYQMEKIFSALEIKR